MKNKIIKIKEEVQIGNVILEKGDFIKIIENKLERKNSPLYNKDACFSMGNSSSCDLIVEDVIKTPEVSEGDFGWMIIFNDGQYVTISDNDYYEVIRKGKITSTNIAKPSLSNGDIFTLKIPALI